MTQTRILVFAGSTRTGSLSTKLAAAAARVLEDVGAKATHVSLADYDMPIYNGDLEKAEGIPEAATRLARQIAASDGVFVATPEYNNSVPPLLKNAIDWVSRVENSGDTAYRDKAFAIGGTSNGMIGGARALIDCRKIVQAGLGAVLISSKIEVSRAQDAFNEAGDLTVEPVSRLLRRGCEHLVDISSRLAR